MLMWRGIRLVAAIQRGWIGIATLIPQQTTLSVDAGIPLFHLVAPLADL